MSNHTPTKSVTISKEKLARFQRIALFSGLVLVLVGVAWWGLFWLQIDRLNAEKIPCILYMTSGCNEDLVYLGLRFMFGEPLEIPFYRSTITWVGVGTVLVSVGLGYLMDDE